MLLLLLLMLSVEVFPATTGRGGGVGILERESSELREDGRCTGNLGGTEDGRSGFISYMFPAACCVRCMTEECPRRLTG